MNGNTSREEMLESVALYALGVLPREDAALIAAFIANDDQARREYLDLRAGADAVAYTAEEPVDSSRSRAMKDRLMARVRADSGSPVARRRVGPSSTALLWGTGLAAAAAIVFSVVTVAQDLTMRGDLAAAQRRIGALQTRIAVSDRVAAQDRRALTDLLSSDAKRYDVSAGTVVVRRDRIYLAFSKLPPLPKGRVYQAWTAAKGAAGVAPSRFFLPNADGVAIVELPVDANRIAAVALSVEPDGGSKAPTTKPLFVRPLT